MEPVQAQFQNPETCGQNTDTAGHTKEGFRGLFGIQYNALDRSLSHCDTSCPSLGVCLQHCAGIPVQLACTPFGFVS